MENFLVDPGRVGLPISSLQMRRSTTELRALMVRVEGIEPSTSPHQNKVRCGACLFTVPRTKFWVVGDEGIEPSTSSLSEKRSTDELVAQNFSAGSERRSTSELHAQDK